MNRILTILMMFLYLTSYSQVNNNDATLFTNNISIGNGNDTFLVDITIGDIVYDNFFFSGNSGSLLGIISDTLVVTTVNTTIDASNNLIINATNNATIGSPNLSITSTDMSVASASVGILSSNTNIDTDTFGVTTGDLTYLFLPTSAVATYEYATGSNSITLDSNNAEVAVQLGRYKYLAGGYNFQDGSAELAINDTLLDKDRCRLYVQFDDGLRYHHRDTVLFQIDTFGAIIVTGTPAHAGRLRLGEDTDNGGNYFGINAASALAGNINVTMPSANGTNGQVLTTNGIAGVLSWTTVGGGGWTDGGNNVFLTDSTNNVFIGSSNPYGGAVDFKFYLLGGEDEVFWSEMYNRVGGNQKSLINQEPSQISLECSDTAGSGITGLTITSNVTLVYASGVTLTVDSLIRPAAYIRGANIHNNADAQGNASNQDIRSGTYTPTLTNVTNVAASTAYQCQWLRVGNVVTVSGKVDIDVTLGIASELGMSLPIASDLANEQNAGGTASSAAAASLVSAIRADATNNRAAFVFTAVSVNNDSYFFEFSYLVL